MGIDVSNVVSRFKAVLPSGWFADTTPVLDAILQGLATAWVELFGLLDQVAKQSRIGTAAGIFVDIAAQDYFGKRLPRRAAETDTAYSTRIQKNVIRARGTRDSVVQVLKDLTGRTPKLFEPRNPADTGGYNVYLGYGMVGGYGSLTLPYQFFVSALRPNRLPVNNASGYGSGPGGYNTVPAFYADTSEFQGNVSDAEIYSSITEVLPVTTIAWTNISN